MIARAHRRGERGARPGARAVGQLRLGQRDLLPEHRDRLTGERLDERVDVREALVRLLLHRVRDRVGHGRGHGGRERGERRRLLVDDLEHDLWNRRALERGLAGQHLVDDRAEREHVGALVDGGVLTGRLLGRHVLRRAEQRALLRLHGLRAADLGDAEIEDLRDLDRVAVVLGGDQEDVLRLEIAVHDAGPVGRRERRADLANDRERVLELQRSGAQPLRERLALEVLEQHARGAIRERQEVIDAHDVRMIELRRDLRLALEASEDLVVDEIRMQHLDRDLLAGESVVAREEHRPHAAATDQGFDRVGVRDDGPHIDRRAGGG